MFLNVHTDYLGYMGLKKWPYWYKVMATHNNPNGKSQ